MTPAERAEHGTRHLEHELAQIVRLRKRIEHGLADTPDDLVRAVRVAYAAHFRSLLEFFHNGRPSNAGPRDREDLRYTDFVCPDDANPSDQFGGWTDNERKRLEDADKLLAHLSVLRDAHGDRPEWGSDSDHAIIDAKIDHLLANVQHAERRFPDLVSERQGETVVITHMKRPSSVQRVILALFGAAVIWFGLLHVPWQDRLMTVQLQQHNPGVWSAIWLPPEARQGYSVVLDISRWAAVMITLGILAVVAWIIGSPRNR